MNDYATLSVAAVEPNPDQPRQWFDPQALDELAASIASHGVLQPIVVRPDNDTYRIVAGERRWRATQQAGLATIPARILDGMSDIDAYVLSVSENVNRKDMTLVEEARAYGTLLSAGKTPEEVADLFGKTKAYVTWRIGLLGLIDDCATMVARGQMSPTLGYYVAKLSPAGQQVVSSKNVRGEFATDRDAIEFARAVMDRETQTVAFFDELGPPETEQDTATRVAAHREAARQVDRILALSEALAELARTDPADVAAALGGDLATNTAKVETVAKHALNARRVMSQAKARAATAHLPRSQ